MPLYDYLCKTCLALAEEIKGSPLDEGEQYDCLFETKHSMNPTPEELNSTTECPRCESHDTVKTYNNVKLISYIRGYGYLDKVGRNRDMNLYKLTVKDDEGNSQDPYLPYRETGEADDLVVRLHKEGKHQPKTQYYPVDNTAAANAVKDIKQIT